ncbi:MAG: hypothetical protein KKC89_01325, partial [Gammaproteobacteria bacterium]|nr:hypothetical protein [Gammaproteobacteria bacterium]
MNKFERRAVKADAGHSKTQRLKLSTAWQIKLEAPPLAGGTTFENRHATQIENLPSHAAVLCACSRA